MDRWSGCVAVVTGASVGVGAEIATRLASVGMTVVGAARRHHLIQDLQKRMVGTGTITARKCDFEKPNEIEELFRWVEENVGSVSILINNAAVLFTGTVHEVNESQVSVEEITSLLNLNIRGYILCSRAAVKSMKSSNREGHIININSLVGHKIPMLGTEPPVINIYPSTKHAVTALTEMTRQELACSESRIRVTSISPGAVKTAMIKMITSIPEGSNMLEPEDVADAVLYAIGTPYRCNVTEITLRCSGEKYN